MSPLVGVAALLPALRFGDGPPAYDPNVEAVLGVVADPVDADGMVLLSTWERRRAWVVGERGAWR